MKIAIVSDIHADAPALQRFFDDLPSVDRVLCAGDVISDFRFCPDTVELLRRHDVPIIRGNHEQSLFHGQNPGYLAKCRERYDASLLDHLANAPVTFDLEAEGATLHMVHATPWEPFSGYITPGSPRLQRLADMPCDFIILGHTHIPMVERAGDVTVINPGSPSQPRDGDRRGSYAILDLSLREATIRRLPLD